MMMMMDEVESAGEMVDTIPEGDGEDAVFNALGIMTEPHRNPQLNNSSMMMTEDTYKVIPNPDADVVDLSDLRGTRAPTTGTEHLGMYMYCSTRVSSWYHLVSLIVVLTALFLLCRYNQKRGIE
jgi:hypothetical protein